MKNFVYDTYKALTTDKNKSVTNLITNALNMAQGIFQYTGLPDTIPAAELEYILNTTGQCFMYKHEGEIYAFQGVTGGVPDVYGRPSQFNISNPALQLTKTVDISDGVLFKNDFMSTGILPDVGRWAALITDTNISMNTAVILTRIMMLISAGDDQTKESADKFIENIKNGDFTVIGESSFFDGVKLHTMPNNNSGVLSQYIEVMQYQKANLLNSIGLKAGYNMKRERLNAAEVGLDADNIIPFIDNMLKEREKAVEKMNELYNLNISVKLSGIWEVNDPKPTDPDTQGEADTQDDPDTQGEPDEPETTQNDPAEPETTQNDPAETAEPAEPAEPTENETKK